MGGNSTMNHDYLPKVHDLQQHLEFMDEFVYPHEATFKTSCVTPQLGFIADSTYHRRTETEGSPRAIVESVSP